MRLAGKLGTRLLIGLVMVWVVTSGASFLVRLMPGHQRMLRSSGLGSRSVGGSW
jgi:hypothetical protein